MPTWPPWIQFNSFAYNHLATPLALPHTQHLSPHASGKYLRRPLSSLILVVYLLNIPARVRHELKFRSCVLAASQRDAPSVLDLKAAAQMLL
jgi:hypothetical protein